MPDLLELVDLNSYLFACQFCSTVVLSLYLNKGKQSHATDETENIYNAGLKAKPQFIEKSLFWQSCRDRLFMQTLSSLKVRGFYYMSAE